MVLYVEMIKENCENYLVVVHMLRALCEDHGLVHEGYEEAVANTKANIEICDQLLQSGIRELRIPRLKKPKGS